jgi:pyruvate dehydrogenase E1 component alpha subunit
VWHNGVPEDESDARRCLAVSLPICRIGNARRPVPLRSHFAAGPRVGWLTPRPIHSPLGGFFTVMAIRNSDVMLAGLTREQLLDLHSTMLLIRRFEEKAGEEYTLGKIGGFLHLYVGQEAVATGAIPPLRPDDYVISSYREHGHAIVKGADPNAVMAELFGRATGVSKGKGGSMHIFDDKHHFHGGYAIVGAQMPIACGYGLAQKFAGKGDITMTFFGDGAVDEGAFHEAMNLAELWSLPVVFICENNLYSMGNALAKAWSVASLEPRAAAYGMAYEKVDGMDVLAVRETALRAIDRARRESKPTLIEAMTYRFRGHSMADPAAYRPKDEVERWRSTRDPIMLFEQKLRDLGIDQDTLRAADDRATQVAEAAAAFADSSPFPDLSALTDDVMVDPTGAIAWRRPRK